MIAISHYPLEVNLRLFDNQLTSVVANGLYSSAGSHITVNSFIIVEEVSIFIKKRVFFFDVSNYSSNKIITETTLSCIVIITKIFFVIIYLALFFFLIFVFYSFRMNLFHFIAAPITADGPH